MSMFVYKVVKHLKFYIYRIWFQSTVVAFHHVKSLLISSSLKPLAVITREGCLPWKDATISGGK